MAITESRLKDGTLTLGTTPTDMDFSCQVTNARINSSYDDDGDAVETLCGDQIAPGRKLSNRTLAGTVIQDWTAGATSVIEWLWDHDLEVVDFTYMPNVTGPTITGKVRVEVPAETYGGDVNSRTTSDFEWGITTPVVRTPPGPVAATGATAGTPGTWTPGGSTPPANAAGANTASIIATPSSAWATGEYVQGSTAGAAGEMNWNGTTWTAGRAP